MKTPIRPLKLSLLALLAGTLAGQAASVTWTGANSANWSDPGNWNPGLPGTGDALIFDTSGQTAPNNDVTGEILSGITFTPTSATYILGGNSVTLDTAQVVNSNTVLQTIAMPVVLTNAVTFNTVSNLDTTVGDMEIDGTVSGTGALIKNGGATLTLANGSYSGGTWINGGLLVISNTTGNYTNNGGGLMLNSRTYYNGLNVPFTADSSIGVDLLDNTEPVGFDAYGTLGSAGYKFTKIGQGLLRIVGVINASSIDVATGTLGSLGGGIGGPVSVEPLHKLGTAPITVENGAMLRIDDGGVVANAITLNGGDGTSVGGSTHTGALRSSSRNNAGSTTNFNYFTNTITLASDSTIGAYYNTTFISGNIVGSGSLTKIGANPLNLSGSNSFSGNVTINAGTLQIGSTNALPPASSVTINGNSTLDFNGFTPSWGGSLYDDASGNGAVDNSSTNPVSVNLNAATLSCAFKNTGGGALSLVNVSGSSTLSGVSTASGGITVLANSLEMPLSSSASNGLVSVADGATLTLDFKAPGASMKPSGVTLAGAGTGVSLNFNLNFYGTSTKPILNATNGSGILTASGTTTITFNNPGNISVGQFPLIKYKTRAGSGNFVLTPIAGITALIVTNTPNNSIDLKVTSAPITTWKASTTNNLWDTVTTNWTFNGAKTLYVDNNNVPVFFDDTALTNNVNLTTLLTPGSVLVNTTNTYTFGGTGPLNGGILTKNGSGTLVMDVSGNGYASTLISGGTLQVGNNDAFGDLAGNPVDDEATLAFNRSDNFTFASTISGAGQVVQNNTNTTTLGVANTYTGGTVISQGVLKLGVSNCLGAPVSSPLVTVANGASMDLNGKWGTYPQYVVISGTGPTAGRGVLFTTAGMGCTIGCNPVSAQFVRLAGDATIGDSSGDFQLGADHNANPNENGHCGSLDGQNHALTKIGNNTLIVEVTNASPLSMFTLAQGGAIICATATTPFGPNCPIVISNSAIMDTWSQYAQGGLTFANNFTIGAGGATVRNTHGSYGGNEFDNYNGSFTLNDNLWLTCNYKNGSTPGQININGPISGTGGVINNGSYAVSLTGLNTYTGPTVATNNNSLKLSTLQQGGGSYLIYDNSTLDVPPQTGYSTVPMSTLMLGSANGGTLALSRLAALSTTNAPITATNLAVLGNNTVLLPLSAYTSAAAGEYPLIKYTSISGYTAGSIAIGRGLPGYITNDTANSEIAFVIPGGTPVVWTGTGGNNLWNISTTLNFETNGVATDYEQPGILGDAVTFDDSSSSTNVNIPAPVAPTVAIFNTTNKNYLLYGTNITGAAALVKNGPGMLTLSNFNNNFTSGTLVSGGTLKVASSVPPVVALNNLTGTVTVNSGATLDMGSNNLTTLVINVSGAGVGGNGAIQANYAGAAQGWGPSIVNLTGNTTIGGNNRWDLRNGSKQLNATTPGTTLTKVGSGYTALVAATVSTNLGDITIVGGAFSYQTSTAGLGNTNNTIRVGASGALDFYQATVPLVKNAIVITNGGAIQMDGGNTLGQNVIACPVILDSGTAHINGNYYNGLYVSNTISGAGGLAMQYQTYLYLAASNTFTGSVTVPQCNAGNGGFGTRLSLIGNGSITHASSIWMQGIASGQAYAGFIDVLGRPDQTLTLGTGQTLRGDNGSFIRGSVVATAGSAISPGGIATNYQYMSISNSLTFQAGSTNYMDVYKAGALLTNDIINVSNLVTYAGTLQMQTNGPTALAVNDSFKLFNAGSHAGNFANIVDNSGYTWSFNPATGVATVTGLPVTVNTNPTNITYTVSGNNLNLSWPADHTGWRLLVQTNPLTVGLSTNWVTWPNSTTVNAVSIPVNTANGSVFFRLVYP